ncbi:YdcF family protein [Alcaligenaceae bacterium CGII-47]|nr:YdcF family protein [Alcaligenaceae bacterium CGII-47]
MTFSSFLANLIIPLNLSITLLLLAVIFFIIRWRKIAALIAASALAWLVFWSLPTTTLWAGGLLEQRYPYVAPLDLPKAQAIVVLGGNTMGGRKNWFKNDAHNKTWLRTDTAASLYRAERAPLIVVSGAAFDGGQSEAKMMTNALEQLGIPSTAIVQEDHSDTTYENALYTVQQLRQLHIDRILLVTSALHMPRAMASFQKQGITPIAASSPPQIVVPQKTGFSFWTPDMHTLNASRSIIKEYLGLLVYWVRGWV